MKNERIAAVIDAVNQGGPIPVFQHVRIDNVRTAKAVLRLPDGSLSDGSGLDCYLIFQGESECVGAVLDMGKSELHAFVRPSFRRRGLMSAALKSVILPHLFHGGRTEQRVTFSTEEVWRMNEKIGFQRVDADNAVAFAADFPAFDHNRCEVLPVASERIRTLRNRIAVVVDCLRWIRAGVAQDSQDYVSQKVEGFLQAVSALIDVIGQRFTGAGHVDQFQAGDSDNCSMSVTACPMSPPNDDDFRKAVQSRLSKAAIELFWVETEVGPRLGEDFTESIYHLRMGIVDLSDHPALDSIRSLSMQGPIA